MTDIVLTVNGATCTGSPEARKTLADFLRDDLDLTGTHVGCEHGVCGACTVIVDGRAVRSCLMLAVQAAGSEVTTIEGLAPDGGLGTLQQAMWDAHSFQCGFCTPGFVMQATAFLRNHPDAACAGERVLYYGDTGGAGMVLLRSVRARWPRPRGAPRADAAGPALSWIGDERIAISGVPPAWAVGRLTEQGVTHVVNCRPRAQVRRHGDLAAEQAAFGPGQVAHAPMQDHGRRQRPVVWAAAACFAVRVLEDQPQAGVLIHCSAGRRRSAMLAYAVLRLRGHDRARAAALVLRYRTEAQLVPAYVRSVERWLATGESGNLCIGQLRRSADFSPGWPVPGREGCSGTGVVDASRLEK